MDARGIPAGGGRLRTEAIGEVELEEKTLVLKRIHVRYRLRIDADADRATIDRVLGFHQSRCPVARSIGGCVAITTELELEE